MTRRFAAAACALLVALCAVAPAFAAGGVDVRGLERELRCITCGTTLDVSNAPSALQLKRYIREKAAAGWTGDQIKAALVQQFGREILATPPKEGFDLVAWLVPALAVAAGLAAVPVITRRWARHRTQAAPVAVDATPEELARLQRELDELGP